MANGQATEKQTQESEKPVERIERLRTLEDWSASIDHIVAAVESGKLPPEQARIMLRGRSEQLKGAALSLQAKKLATKQIGGDGKAAADPIKLIADAS